MPLKVGELFAEFGGKDSGFTKMCDSAQSKMESVGKKISSVGKGLAVSVTAPLAAVGTAAFTAGSKFEASMSQVAATMGMTADEVRNGSGTFKLLEDAAKDAGKTTAFSASEASDALNYLALAGYSAEQATTALPKVLNLASAGNLDLAYASDLVTDSMSSLGLEMSEMDSFMDKMAKTSQKSNTNVAQLGEGFLTVGGTAKALKGGVTEASTVLGIFADNGIKGAEGGTSLRNVILSLSAPTDKAATALETLGVETKDAEGNLRPLNEVFNDLGGSLDGLGTAERAEVLSSIFNKVDLKSVNALIANSGERFDELSGYVDDAKGACQEMAETQLANLQGQLTILKSGLEAASIKIYEALLPAFEGIVGKVQSLVDWFTTLDDSQVESIVKWAAIAASIAPVLLAVGKVVSIGGKLVSGIGTLSNMVSGFIPMLQSVGAVIGGISAPILIVVGAIAAFTAAIIYCWNTNEEFRDALIEVWDEVKEFLSATWNLIKATAEVVFNALKAFWSEWGGQITKVFTTTFDLIGAVFQTAVTLIGNILKIFTAAFKGDWEGCWTAVKELFVQAWEGIKAIGETFFRALEASIGVMLSLIGSAWTSAWNSIKSFFSNIWTSMLNTITTMKQNVVSKVQELARGIVQAIKDLPKEAANIAGHFITGMANGIKNGISSVVNAAKDMAGKVVSSTKNMLGIHSPSRVMMELGEFTGQGFKVGLEDTQDMIANAAANLLDPEDFKIPDVTQDLDFTQQADLEGAGTSSVTNYYTMEFNIESGDSMDEEALATRISRKIQQQIDRNNRGGGIVY